MKLRQHRGTLADALATVIEIPATHEAVVEAINAEISSDLGRKIPPSDVHVEPYGYDSRIGWNTHIVTIMNYGVYGYTDGPIDS